LGGSPLGSSRVRLVRPGPERFKCSLSVEQPEDLKRLRIRVPEVPVFRAMVASWGATPTSIPMAEIFTGVQGGIGEGIQNDQA
jgi:TRAP-type C4-dicarboxylate transport system substrate-binding protein